MILKKKEEDKSSTNGAIIALAGPWDKSAAPNQPSNCLLNSEPEANIIMIAIGLKHKTINRFLLPKYNSIFLLQQRLMFIIRYIFFFTP